jgi:hypothetical protein
MQDFVNSTGKFNSIVVKMLKPVLYSSCDGPPLNYKKHFAIIQFTNTDPLSPTFHSC